MQTLPVVFLLVELFPVEFLSTDLQSTDEVAVHTMEPDSP